VFPFRGAPIKIWKIPKLNRGERAGKVKGEQWKKFGSGAPHGRQGTAPVKNTQKEALSFWDLKKKATKKASKTVSWLLGGFKQWEKGRPRAPHFVQIREGAGGVGEPKEKDKRSQFEPN